MMDALSLGSRPLTLEDVYHVAYSEQRVVLSSEAVQKIEKAHSYLQSRIALGETLYGVNTGFGILSKVRIQEEDIETLQYNLLRSHACGVGPALPDAAVKAMLLLRANNLAYGHSGVSLQLVEQIIAVLNRGIIPIIPEQGSVGASGDLAPLSHLALVLIGEGKARYKGQEMSGAMALRGADLTPIRLGPKEGLALINGTQFMTALGSLQLLEAEYLAGVADLAGAMSVEAMRGTRIAFEEEIHAVRPHLGQVEVAKNLRSILTSGGEVSEIAKSHAQCDKVQDPYSLRCMPQVHGASRDAMAYVRKVLETEINSVTDNPLIFPDQKKILSGGNFHGQYVAMAMDFLAIAVAELGSISEQRLEKLINPAISDLPAFLTSGSGLNSGFMIVQVAAASLVSENKTLCHPACVDTIPTSADKEDHVSMGAWAACKAGRVIQNVRKVLSMEILAATQGIDFLRPMKSSDLIEKAHFCVRKKIARVDSDRAFYEDFQWMDEVLGSSEFKQLVRGIK